MTKIQWIWGRSAYTLAMRDHAELDKAIESFDLRYFQTIPGIWPKTAKRILVELKTELAKRDTMKLMQDDTLVRDVVTSLKSLGYDPKKIKLLLVDYPHSITNEEIPSVMQRLVERL